MHNENFAQDSNLEFIPATNSYYPYINSYSDVDGLTQYYLKDAKWIQNKAIPNFIGVSDLKDICLQYVTDKNGNNPQLFVYSKSTGDFRFYLLTNDGWTINDEIPMGKIGIDSDSICARYSPSTKDLSSYIFSYSSEEQNIEVLEIVENKWKHIEYFPNELPE